MTSEKRTFNPLTVVLALSGVFFLIFLVVSGVMFVSKTPSGSGRGLTSSGLFGGSAGSVGVVEMKGIIMDSKKTLAKLERFEEDDLIKAVVLRLNSPGGSVAPSQEIYEAVKNYKKPLVVSMGSVAASGAFYIACGAKKVFANPGTLTGSIGVIMEFANLEKLYDWAKVNRYSIKTGKFKDVGAEYRQMTDDERALLQTMVNNILDQFKQAVVSGRKIPLEQVSAVADGRVFTGSQAKALKLVDELGTLNDAIHEAAKLAEIQGKPHVVYSDRQKRGLLEVLLDDSSLGDSSGGSESSGSRVSLLIRLLELAVGAGNSGAGTPSTGLKMSPGVYWLWGGAEVF